MKWYLVRWIAWLAVLWWLLVNDHWFALPWVFLLGAEFGARVQRYVDK